jgi:hypothetical protein
MTAGFDDYGSATGHPTDSANMDWTDPNATTDWADPNASITDPDAGPIDANPNPSIFDTGADFVSSDSLSFDATSMDPAATTSYRTPGIYSTADTSYVAPGFGSTSLDTTTNDPNMYYANPGSPTYSQGDHTAILEHINAQDQLENTQANLWNSEERLDGAIDQGGHDAMEGETRSPWRSGIISIKHSMTKEVLESDETTYEILARLEAFKTKIHRSNTLTQTIRKMYFRAVCCFDSAPWDITPSAVG